MLQSALFCPYSESVRKRVQAKQYGGLWAALKERCCTPVHLSASRFVSEVTAIVMASLRFKGNQSMGTGKPARPPCLPLWERRVWLSRSQAKESRDGRTLTFPQARRSGTHAFPAACSTAHEEGRAQPRQGAPCSDSAFPSVNWDVSLASDSGQRRSCLGSSALNSHVSIFKFFNRRLRGTLLSNGTFPSFLLLCQRPKFHIEHSIPPNILSGDYRLSTCHYMLFTLDSQRADVHLNSTVLKEEKQLLRSPSSGL